MTTTDLARLEPLQTVRARVLEVAFYHLLQLYHRGQQPPVEPATQDRGCRQDLPGRVVERLRASRQGLDEGSGRRRRACGSRKGLLMSIKRKVLAVAAMLTMVGGVSTVGTLSASAATPACGQRCISIFSRALGTYAQPNFVEAVLQGVAKVGQPVILQQASNSDPSEDLIVPRAGLVADFFTAGMVSAKVNRHYGNLRAAQIEYAPLGVASGLCVGLATTAFQNEGLTLQPCGVPATTVWIVDTADSPATAADGYFPLVNGSTRNVSRPFVMDYPRNASPTDEPTPQIHVRHLQLLGNEHTVPDRQLWGTRFGVLP